MAKPQEKAQIGTRKEPEMESEAQKELARVELTLFEAGWAREGDCWTKGTARRLPTADAYRVMRLSELASEPVISVPAKPFIPLSQMPPEEQEAKSTIHGGKGLKIIPLKSGRYSISDTWSRLISRDQAGLEAKGESEFGFAPHELLSALQILFATHSFVCPPEWGREALKERKTLGTASSEYNPSTATETTKTAEELGL